MCIRDRVSREFSLAAQPYLFFSLIAIILLWRSMLASYCPIKTLSVDPKNRVGIGETTFNSLHLTSINLLQVFEGFHRYMRSRLRFRLTRSLRHRIPLPSPRLTYSATGIHYEKKPSRSWVFSYTVLIKDQNGQASSPYPMRQ